MKGNCLGQRPANVQEVFSRQQKCSSMLLLEGTDLPREACTMHGCRLRSYFRSVAHELFYFTVISKLSAIDMIALRSKYHLSLVVLVNCTRQHNNGKVPRKKKKKVTANLLFSWVDFSQTKFYNATATLPISSSRTLHLLLTADIQDKEVLLVFNLTKT